MSGHSWELGTFEGPILGQRAVNVQWMGGQRAVDGRSTVVRRETCRLAFGIDAKAPIVLHTEGPVIPQGQRAHSAGALRTAHQMM